MVKFAKTILATTIIALIIVSSSLLTIQAYTEDSITKPSIPEFTVRIVAYPYDVPPKTTTTIDQYNGKETTITQPGYHVENKSIEVKIKNQLFTPYTFTTSTGYDHYTEESYSYVRNVTVNFYYKIAAKGHFGNDTNWTLVTDVGYTYSGPPSNAQLNSEYTVFSIPPNYPRDAVLDFKVKALTGYYTPYGRGLAIMGYDFYGQESDWSNIQTVSMSDSAIPNSISSNPTSTNPTPSVPEFSLLTILPILLTTLIALAIVRKRLQRNILH